MKRTFLITLLAVLTSILPVHSKEVYIPQQTLKDEGYDPSATRNNLSVPWCRYRSRESENVIVFWGAGYGDNDPNSTAVPDAYRVDIDDMLQKLEYFYDLNVNQLKFADLSHSNLSKYKMVICLYYTTDWMAYGSGFDNVIGGMWVSPSTCHPVGETIAHEIGHSFQYQVNCDLGGATGFRYGFPAEAGCSLWEATAEWQAVMAYPDLMYSLSLYIYRQSHQMAFTHEWHRYQSYWMHYYWVDKYGLDMVGRIWRGSTQWGDDVNQVYMKLQNMSVEDLYREYCDAAMHFVTWDFQNEDWKRRGSYFDIGNFVYKYVPVGDDEFQVSYYSCPQSTGYNVIPLEVPNAGTTISTHFTALPPGCELAEGDPRQFWNGAFVADVATDRYNTFTGMNYRGFRLGYVALLNNGQRVYKTEDKVYCRGTKESSVDVDFTVPANVSRLWLVVSPALSNYIMHGWDENILNDDMWPYKVKFTGTSIPGASNYYLYDPVTDQFLSRGGTNGTQAVVDKYGIPVNVANKGDYVELHPYDNINAFIGGTSNVTTVASSGSFKKEITNDGIRFKNMSNNKFLSFNSLGNVVNTESADDATCWLLLTSGQRNKVLSDRKENQERELALLANISLGNRSLESHAESDFNGVEMTSRIKNAALTQNTSSWKLTGTGCSAESNALEVYQGTGTTLSQTLSGMPEGLYSVSLSAFYRDGFPASCVDYSANGFSNMSNASLQANGYATLIADWASNHSGDTWPNWRSEAKEAFNQGLYLNKVFTYVGEDGELTISFNSPQYIDGGWFCFSDMHLTYYGKNEELVPDYDIIESDVSITPERTIANGTYYMRNVASGLFLTAGNAFGTQASLGTEGLDFRLVYRTQGQYSVNSNVSNGTGFTYLGAPTAAGDVPYVDSERFYYAFNKLDNGNYAISFLGKSSTDGVSKKFYIGYSQNNPTLLNTRLADIDDADAQWQLLTRDQLVEEMQAATLSATEDNPKDITNYVRAANFGRNDQRISTYWKGSPVLGGTNENQCAEKFNTAFDVYQTVTDLLPGTYRVTAQGFYRHGLPEAAFTAFSSGSEDGGAVLYANDEETPLMSIFSEARQPGYPSNQGGRWVTPSGSYTVPDDMTSASVVFSAGYYVNQVDVEVGEDGKLIIGFKKTAGATPDGNWSIFDNVRLYAIKANIADGITDVKLSESDSDNSVYDLSGRIVLHVEDPSNIKVSLPRGIYIYQGRKVLVK